MASKVEMWRAGSGAMYDTEHAALCDDLGMMLTATDAINEASARKAVEFLTIGPERLKALRDLISRVADTHPKNPVAQPVPFDGAPNIDSLTKPPEPVEGCGRIGTNTGHGHVWERPDRVRARCGGPKFCRVCQDDQLLMTMCAAKEQQ